MTRNTVRRNIRWTLFALAVLAIAACTDHGPVVIGNPAPPEATPKKVTPGKLIMSYMMFMDNFVETDVAFAAKLNTTPLEGHVALLVRHDYGSFYVLVAEGRYEEEIARLKSEQPMTVFGRVTAAKLPTDATPKVAIVVEE